MPIDYGPQWCDKPDKPGDWGLACESGFKSMVAVEEFEGRLGESLGRGALRTLVDDPTCSWFGPLPKIPALVSKR